MSSRGRGSAISAPAAAMVDALPPPAEPATLSPTGSERWIAAAAMDTAPGGTSPVPSAAGCVVCTAAPSAAGGTPSWPAPAPGVRRNRPALALPAPDPTLVAAVCAAAAGTGALLARWRVGTVVPPAIPKRIPGTPGKLLRRGLLQDEPDERNSGEACVCEVEPGVTACQTSGQSPLCTF